MKFEICTHTTHLLKTGVALPWTRNLLTTSRLRPCTKLVEWLQESTSKSKLQSGGEHLQPRSEIHSWGISLSYPMDSKRKHNCLCTDSGCKVLKQQKTRHWTCSQREYQCVTAPQQSSKLHLSALDPLMCHILMNTQRDCHCIPCLRNWPSRVSWFPVCPSLMMQLLCLHHNHTHPPSTTWQDWWM